MTNSSLCPHCGQSIGNLVSDFMRDAVDEALSEATDIVNRTIPDHIDPPSTGALVAIRANAEVTTGLLNKLRLEARLF